HPLGVALDVLHWHVTAPCVPVQEFSFRIVTLDETVPPQLEVLSAPLAYEKNVFISDAFALLIEIETVTSCEALQRSVDVIENVIPEPDSHRHAAWLAADIVPPWTAEVRAPSRAALVMLFWMNSNEPNSTIPNRIRKNSGIRTVNSTSAAPSS